MASAQVQWITHVIALSGYPMRSRFPRNESLGFALVEGSWPMIVFTGLPVIVTWSGRVLVLLYALVWRTRRIGCGQRCRRYHAWGGF